MTKWERLLKQVWMRQARELCPLMFDRMLMRPMEELHPLSAEIMASPDDGFF